MTQAEITKEKPQMPECVSERNHLEADIKHKLAGALNEL
ncbi:MAG: hypothetical protein AWU57_1999 [Marinobacter sp. T13-3]|nr:MAG: hypothetical protein AWU57_1999 [Marinobacter sp. T13-3]